jgi:hypothetical protein
LEAEEARKKRPFFPEDIVDSDSLFHFVPPFQILELAQKFVSKLTDSIKNKNSPSTSGTKSYSAVPPEFVVSRLSSSLLVSFDEGPVDEQPADALYGYNGLSRHRLLMSFTAAVPCDFVTAAATPRRATGEFSLYSPL